MKTCTRSLAWGLGSIGIALGLFAAPLGAQAPLPPGAWTTVDEAELVPAMAGPNFWFGWHVDLDGDTLAVSGGLGFDGSVFVFVRDGAGWREQARIRPAAQPLTGACAVDGDVLAVGAYTDAHAGFQSGSVYVYRRTGETWSLEQQLFADDARPDDRFGYSVDLEPGLLIVGAPRHLAYDPGRAYVFRHDGAGWNQEARLEAATPSIDELGHEVAIEGDTAVAAAYERHSCFVFRYAAGSWTQEAELVGGLPQDWFGTSAALSGDTVAVGAPEQDSDRGAVYVFERQGGTWPQQAVLTGSAAAGDQLGWRVAIDGQLILAGARLAEEGRPSGGCALLFRGAGGQWEELGRLVPRTPLAGALFGAAVTVDGNLAAIGAYLDDAAGFHSGAAYAYELFAGEASNYGASLPNSAGVVARMALTGTPTLSGAATLHAVGAPAGKGGLFFYGVQTASLPFGNGMLCVSPFSPGLKRLPPLVETCAHGSAWHDLQAGELPPGMLPGTTLFFQFWFRDQPAGGQGSNLSDGLGVTFAP